MKLFELDSPKTQSLTNAILQLLEAENANQVQELKATIMDLLLSYKATAPGNPKIPLDKFLASINIPGLDIQNDKSLVIEVLESLSDVVKEVDVSKNQIVLKSALTLRNKKADPEKNKEKVSRMAARAIKKRTK
jgi:hypothetical protein